MHHNAKLDDIRHMPTIFLTSVRRRLSHNDIEAIDSVYTIYHTLPYEAYRICVAYDNFRDDEIELYRCMRYYRFIHHRSMRTPFNCPLRPDHCHEDLLQIKEKSTSYEMQLLKPYKL